MTPDYGCNYWYLVNEENDIHTEDGILMLFGTPGFAEFVAAVMEVELRKKMKVVGFWFHNQFTKMLAEFNATGVTRVALRVPHKPDAIVPTTEAIDGFRRCGR